jgi:hypothetical protein
MGNKATIVVDVICKALFLKIPLLFSRAYGPLMAHMKAGRGDKQRLVESAHMVPPNSREFVSKPPGLTAS